MPIYEYACKKCGQFETMQRITDRPLTRCPTCKGKVTKLMSNTSFQLKGSGWYVTDYARKDAGAGKDTGAGKDSGTKAKGDSKSEGASDSGGEASSSSASSDAKGSASETKSGGTGKKSSGKEKAAA